MNELSKSIMPQNAPGVKAAAAEPFQAAHRYAQLGYPVFPVRPDRKDPATEHGLRDATTDPNTIDQWLRRTPGYNIGMSADDVLVLDVDVRMPEDAPEDERAAAQEEFVALVQELFGDAYVPAGMPVVRTPNNGFHIYMRCDRDWAAEWGVGNTSITLGSRFAHIKQLDLKGCGRGYTLLPPSLVDGVQYRFVGASTWLPPRNELPMMPATCGAALEKLISAARPKRSNRNGNRKHPTQPQEPPSNELTVDQINQIVEAAAAIWNEGRRQDLALALAGILRKQGVSLEQAMDVVAGVVAATADEEPGKRLTAVHDTYSTDIDSIAGWTLLTNEEQAALEPVLGRTKPDPANHSTPTQTPSTSSWRSRVQRIAEIQASDYPEMEWLVDGVLPARGLVVLAGRPKSGKSWLALDLALSVAAGADCLGRPTGTTGATIYLALEDSPARIKERSDIIGLSSDNAYIATSWWAADQGGFEELQEMVRELRPKLIIIDTLSAFKAGSAVVRKPQFEIDYEQARKLKTIADENSCCVLVVHHTRKADADDVFDTVSGTLGLNAVADTIAILQHSRGSDSGKLHVTGRDVSDEQFALSFREGRWTIVDAVAHSDAPSTRDKVLRAIRLWGPAKPRELRDIAAQEGIGYDALRQMLRTLVSEGVLARDEFGQYYCPAAGATPTDDYCNHRSQNHKITKSQDHNFVICDLVIPEQKAQEKPAGSWDHKHAARVLGALQHGPKSIRELSDQLALEHWQVRRGLQLLQTQGQVEPLPDGRWQAVAAETEGAAEGMTIEIGIPESAEPWIQQSARRTRDWMLEQLAKAPRDRKWLLRQAPADDEYPAVFVFDALVRAGAVVVSRAGAARLSQAGHELWARIQASRAG